MPAQLGQLKTGQDGKGLLRIHLWCPDDLLRLWDRIENRVEVSFTFKIYFLNSTFTIKVTSVCVSFVAGYINIPDAVRVYLTKKKAETFRVSAVLPVTKV